MGKYRATYKVTFLSIVLKKRVHFLFKKGLLNFFFAHLSNDSKNKFYMNRFIPAIAALLLSFASFAQDVTKTDEKIAEALGQQQFEALQQNNAAKLAYYTLILNEGAIIQNYGQEKIMANLNTIPKIKLKPQFSSEALPDLSDGIDNLNILKFDFQISPDSKTICRIDETGYVIIILSAEEIDRKLNSSEAK